MKKYFMIFAAALTVFAACQEEMAPEINTNEGGISNFPIEMTFTASNESGTKTAINGEQIIWESDDEIKVLWSNTGSNKAIAEPYNENTCAQFTTDGKKVALTNMTSIPFIIKKENGNPVRIPPFSTYNTSIPENAETLSLTILNLWISAETHLKVELPIIKAQSASEK